MKRTCFWLVFGSVLAAGVSSATEPPDKAGAHPTPLKVLSPSPRYADTFDVLTRTDPIIKQSIQSQKQLEEQFQRELAAMHFEKVLDPRQLTRAEGLANSRDLLSKVSELQARMDQEAEALQRATDSRLREVVPGTEDWAWFWQRYDKAVSEGVGMRKRITDNQATMRASIAAILDVMEAQLGNTQVAPTGKIVFADPAALEQFNLRLQAFARNALEEQRLQKLMSSYRSAQAQTAR